MQFTDNKNGHKKSLNKNAHKNKEERKDFLEKRIASVVEYGLQVKTTLYISQL